MNWLLITIAVSIAGITFALNAASPGHEQLLDHDVLFVFAHPDDESMFFGPTVDFVSRRRHGGVHLLCLSNGNADGLGAIRAKEIVEAASRYKIPASNVHVVEDPKLQDGMRNTWSTTAVASAVGSAIESAKSAGRSISLVITFDGYGISGHANHRACHRGVIDYAREHRGLRVYTLDSVNILRKYWTLLDATFTYLTYRWGSERRVVVCADHRAQARIRDAMVEAHKSQMVWYRQIWISLSRYMSTNSLRREL
ncbi:pig-L [Schizosaccharomyces japonicus yFS275]|uniref:N-acetylglucosaminylphosphatidylinositol deacetylase n=1 Tax=Schizosaccharomyces japonicus (strain yFS275 / FY16936) TaxID=402676 RepID=B6JXV3_SCHJY|nr:pig-L [Schizosaccharomyces japonicus yFS275]EEB06371.1 pig-L [Schizosaccharomyces japonicus yFS275]